MFQRRPAGAPDRFLGWKVALFFAAAGVWTLGAMLSNSRLTLGAIFLAAAALLLRFAPRDDADERDPDVAE